MSEAAKEWFCSLAVVLGIYGLFGGFLWLSFAAMGGSMEGQTTGLIVAVAGWGLLYLGISFHPGVAEQ